MSAGTEIEVTEDKIIFEGQPSKTEGGKAALWVDGLCLESDNEDMCSFPLDPLGLYRVEITYLGSKKERYAGVGMSAHAKKHPWFGEVLTTQEIARRVGRNDDMVLKALKVMTDEEFVAHLKKYAKAGDTVLNAFPDVKKPIFATIIAGSLGELFELAQKISEIEGKDKPFAMTYKRSAGLYTATLTFKED